MDEFNIVVKASHHEIANLNDIRECIDEEQGNK